MSRFTATLEHLGADARAVAEPLVERWSSAKEGLQQRTKDLMLEVGGSLDGAVAANPVDADAFREALAAMRARFRALGDEIPPTFEELTNDWHAATASAGDDADRQPLQQLWSDVRAESEGLRRDIEMLAEMTAIRKSAHWARALRRAAELEWSQPAHCPHCDGELPARSKHGAIDATCASCGTTHRLEPGPAATLYFDAGVHGLAQEAAEIEWLAAQHATRDYHAATAPTAADRDRYRTAARDYWTAYYKAYAELHPGFGSTAADAVAARLAELDDELNA